MKLTETSSNFAEPITLSELRKHLRIEHNEEDSYLSLLIGAARSVAENVIDGIIADRSFSLTLDEFPSQIIIPSRPVDPASIEISYLDKEGNRQIFSNFDYVSDLYLTSVYPDYNVSWPETEAGYNKVTVTFTSGFASYYGQMPKAVKHAVLMIAGTLYDQREDHTAQIKLHEVPTSSHMLLMPYKKVSV